MMISATMEMPADGDTMVELLAGKTASDENFPVATRLLPARMRPHVAAFYSYARAIDDIADDPNLKAAEKIRRLDEFAEAVSGIDAGDPALGEAHSLRRSLATTGVTEQHCIDLTRALKQDAIKQRYCDWNDLMDYCNLSSAPVGRYLIDLHGESASGYPNSDALCIALQVLNHLQDCKADYAVLNRVYLPQDWMKELGVGVEALSAKRSTPALRRVLDRCLDATDSLLALASELPGKLKGPGFAMNAAVIVAIGKLLSAKLRRRDPLVERVTLTKLQYSTCYAYAVGRELFRRVCLQFRRGRAKLG